MKKFIGIIFFIVIITLNFGCSSKSALYTNKELHVSLKYDKDWKPPTSESHYSYGTMGRFKGVDGFFEVSDATGRGETLDEFVSESVKNFKNNGIFGINPKVTFLQVDNQQACLIMPSNDEPNESKNAACLIVEYPKNITIKQIEHAHGTMATFDYFCLYADKNHIIEIAKTIKFIP